MISQQFIRIRRERIQLFDDPQHLSCCDKCLGVISANGQPLVRHPQDRTKTHASGFSTVDYLQTPGFAHVCATASTASATLIIPATLKHLPLPTHSPCSVCKRQEAGNLLLPLETKFNQLTCVYAWSIVCTVLSR